MSGAGEPGDLGGDPACWAHLDELHADRRDAAPPADPESAGSTRPDLDRREHIEQLVVDFYREVAMDDLLGPIFAAEGVDWAVHIPKLVDFWAWQLLGEQAYERNPLRAHEPVHARHPFRTEHYLRWLDLFESTLDGSFQGPLAETARGRARRMAGALQRLLRGESAPGGDAVAPLLRPARRVNG